MKGKGCYKGNSPVGDEAPEGANDPANERSSGGGGGSPFVPILPGIPGRGPGCSKNPFLPGCQPLLN